MMSQWKRTLICLVIGSLTSNAMALTQSWYSIAFDLNGNKVDITYNHPVIADTVVTSQGDGYNNTWYYYPALDRYIMWFYNGPFSTTQTGYIDFWGFVGAINGSVGTYYNLSVGWTSDQWTNETTPPLPSDIQSLSDYYQYASASSISSSSGAQMGSGSAEPHRELTHSQYNPSWVFVSVQGKNAVLYRYLNHGANGTSTPIQGACCNETTGSCYITTTGTCNQGYTYLGNNSTCSSCIVQQSSVDFGDAPSSYKIKLANNGARHYMMNGIQLGQLISGEADGQPSSGANLDTGDDGVEFLTPFAIGQSVDIQVTASTLGAINAWLDLNGDGDWDDPQEQILVDEPVISGSNTLTFFIPEDATVGNSYLHVRYNTTGGLGIYGLAMNGEVEDYAVTITDSSTTTPTLTPVPPSQQIASQWSQPAQRIDDTQPVLSGWSTLSTYNQSPIVSDDWTLDQNQALRGFRWWGCFDQWTADSLPELVPDAFHISIWSNNSTLGSPGTLIWENICDTWNWALAGELEDGKTAFEFTVFLSQDQWFVPDLTNETTYWIGISSLYDEAVPQIWPWQWLTTTESHGSPGITIETVTHSGTQIWPPTLDSVFLSGDYVTKPVNTGWDMAFELITTKPVSSTPSDVQGDVNGDGVINETDLFLLLSIINQL